MMETLETIHMFIHSIYSLSVSLVLVFSPVYIFTKTHLKFLYTSSALRFCNRSQTSGLAETQNNKMTKTPNCIGY